MSVCINEEALALFASKEQELAFITLKNNCNTSVDLNNIKTFLIIAIISPTIDCIYLTVMVHMHFIQKMYINWHKIHLHYTRSLNWTKISTKNNWRGIFCILKRSLLFGIMVKMTVSLDPIISGQTEGPRHSPELCGRGS